MVDHGNLHGVNLPWMEVIDEADGFPVFWRRIAESPTRFVNPFSMRTWGENNVYIGYILRLRLSPYYRLGSNDPGMIPMVRHKVIRIDSGGD